MSGADLDRFAPAYTEDFEYHDENVMMLAWYAERMVARLRELGIKSLISLGIGHRVVGQAVLERLVPQLASYTIVEGSPAALQAFARGAALPPQLQLVHSMFEDYTPAAPVDAVELGFVLEHVDDPLSLLRRYAGFLNPGGTAVIVVPNARSLHRLFGHAAGLLPDVSRLSEHDLALGHKRYFDLASLTGLVEAAGLSLVRSEGVFLKCLTTAQLRSLRLPPEVLRAFCSVATELPAVSNAIYVEAARRA
jgi:SAM-dependent methyltransferase